MNPPPLALSLPCDARVKFNYLYAAADPLLLTQDVLLVSLPNEAFIDVGWYPEHDPKGAYRISAYRSEWQNQLIPPIQTTDAIEVAQEVGRLARTLKSQNMTQVSSWGNLVTTRVVIASGSKTRAKELQIA